MRRTATTRPTRIGGRVWRRTTRWLQTRTIDQPGVHALDQGDATGRRRYPDRVMIGEAYLPIDRLMAYYGADLSGFHLPFNFHLIRRTGRPGRSRAHRGLRSRAAGRGMAELGARQPRPIASCEPDRTRAGPGRGHVAADPERDADDLPGRGDRDGGHSDSAPPGARPVRTECPGVRSRTRSCANAHAVDIRTQWRLHRRATLASPECGCGRAERLEPGERSTIDVIALPRSSVSAATAMRC